MVESEQKKMTLKMVARRLGCSTEWVRKRVDEKQVPVERLSDRHGTILIAEDAIALLGEPGRSFYKKRSAAKYRKSGAAAPRLPVAPASRPGGNGDRRWSMRDAVSGVVRAALENGWKPTDTAGKALADALFAFMDQEGKA